MGFTFTRMESKKSYQHVVEQIQSAICEGQLKQGDRLPPEMKLKDMFETSRGTVREALRVLEQKGLISIRTGVKGGAVVKGANTEAMSDSMALLIRHKKVSLEHLARFRELLEGHAAEQAACSAKAREIDALNIILGKIRDHIATDPDNWEEFHKLDAMFHQTLAGENPLIQANLSTVHENIHTYFHAYLPFSRDLLEEDFKDLCRIKAAVEKKDAVKAGNLARNHVARFASLMGEHLPVKSPKRR